MIYNRGVSASESFAIFDLLDQAKQIKQKIRRGRNVESAQ